MKKRFFIIVFIIVFVFVVFIILNKKNKENILESDFKNSNVSEGIVLNDIVSGDVVIEKDKIIFNSDIYSVSEKKEDIQINKMDDTKIKDIDFLFFNNIKEKFISDGFSLNNSVENFFQFYNKNILIEDLKNDDCVLNLTKRFSDLSVCDFVDKECLDIECQKYDCINYKNNWFKVVYYGDFFGSGDAELIYKDNLEILIANLECADKTKENYENQLFKKLIN